MKKRDYVKPLLGISNTLSLLLLSGCASASIANYVRTGNIGFINPVGLIIGFGIVWYCWVEAKHKNRNPWTWLTLGLIFGFFALLVLVYLSDLPASKEKSS
jgi:RsiW-degrading membrane proteinase PrsW (M82 family)